MTGGGGGGDAGGPGGGDPFAFLPHDPSPLPQNSEGHWELCPVDAVPEDGARGFVLDDAGVRLGVVVVKRGGRLFAYVNSCPHLNIPLNLWPDKFLSPDGQVLQCATHGARFRIEDGLCIAGPCEGRFLTSFRLVVKNRKIVALEP
ncbi:MAG: Rieske 2Fe-2S domain-containing protein [Caenispirillum bisanense]|nr:Rieske 2Fe-2S domain-containing protein [Caenispirillum bisanense]MCA1974994.1 Rieske 2Fe-2S domain-containing protein [Caenispirillum sp.]